MKANTIVILRFSNLDSCLSPKEIVHISTRADPSITIIIEVLQLLEDLLVTSNIHLEVVVLEFPLVLKGTDLLFKLSSMVLGETWAKER